MTLSSPISDLANATGAPESGLRLLFGQLFAYPIFYLFLRCIRNQSKSIQHMYIALTGMAVSWWALGFDTLFHSMLCSLFTWLVLKHVAISLMSTIILSAFNLSYLFIGYILTSSESYDVQWTMPHCVLCLKLISLIVDVFDGSGRHKDSLSKVEAERAIRKSVNDEFPSLMEVFSYSFFIGGYLTGPQFHMKKFLSFIQRNIDDSQSVGEDVQLHQTKMMKVQVYLSLQKLCIGLIYIFVYLIGQSSLNLPDDMFSRQSSVDGITLSKVSSPLQFMINSFWFFVWSKLILSKYISFWLIAEGACIMSGIAYTGDDENHDGMANVKLLRYETATQFSHIIQSFNINTNGWVMHYIYKRLRFLNNKKYSQIGVLLFLALWHGTHSGYYLLFVNEFFVMMFENEFSVLWRQSTWVQKASQSFPFWNVGTGLFGFVYMCFALPTAFLPFANLVYPKYSYFMWNSTHSFVFYTFLIGYALFLRFPMKMILRLGSDKKMTVDDVKKSK